MKKLFNTESAYGPLSKFFHWVIAFFVIGMLLVTYFLDNLQDKLLVATAYNAHKLIGLSIFILVILRLTWTWTNPKPLLLGVKPWEQWLEHTVHGALYLALLAMPIVGLTGVSAAGRPPRLGPYVFSLPIEKNEHLAELAFKVHDTIAIILIVLISLHVLAALYHYFVRKDNVLQRMLP